MGTNGVSTSMRAARHHWEATGIRPLAQVHKAGFPLQLHGAVGSALHGMRNTLVLATVFVANTYDRKAAGRVDKVVRAIDRLRCRLDSSVFQEYPGLPHAARVYYPLSPVAPQLPATALEGVCAYLDATAVALFAI